MDIRLEWKPQWTIPTIVGVASFGVGAAVGYFAASRRKVVEEITIDRENDEMTFRLFDPDDEPRMSDGPEFHQEHAAWENRQSERILTHEEAVKHGFIEEEASEEVVVVTETEDEITIEVVETHDVNIFEIEEPESTPDWNWPEEMEKRHRLIAEQPGAPYILHREEYENEETHYHQRAITYYQGDDVLVDEAEVPIYDARKVVGELVFGKGSGDPSICYVRNDRLEAEYEVILDHGHYAVEVLGAELEHSFDRKQPLHKFRE